MNVTLEQLLEAGSHFGHQVRRWNPKMAPFIYAVHDGVHVFDLAKTREGLIEACEALKKASSEGKIILLVGTKRQAREMIEEAANKTGMPYVSTRWLGGMMTNFEQIKRSLRKLEDMKKNRDTGGYDTYTKRERLLIDREIAKLERVLGGMSTLKRLPDMLFVVDTHEEVTAVREAKASGIPVVGIVDTNADPTDIRWPIPANDDAVKSLSLLISTCADAIAEGKGIKLKSDQAEEAKKAKEAEKEAKKAAKAEAAPISN
jgi:small subunit ribosomal protein S2